MGIFWQEFSEDFEKPDDYQYMDGSDGSGGYVDVVPPEIGCPCVHGCGSAFRFSAVYMMLLALSFITLLQITVIWSARTSTASNWREYVHRSRITASERHMATYVGY